MKEEVKSPSDGGSESSKPAEEQKSGGNSFLRIFSYADRLGWILNVLAIGSAIAAGTILPLMDLVFGKTITTFTGFGQGSLDVQEFSSQLVHWTLWFIYLFVAKFALTYIWSFCLNLSAMRTTKALRVDLLRQTLRQDLAFYDQNDSGSVSVHVTTNGNLINTGISEKMGIIIQGLSTFITAFIVALAVNWKLTLITIAVIPTILITIGICLQIEIGLDTRILKSYAQAGSLADEVFASIRTVHAFWAQPSLASKYASYLEDARKIGRKKNVLYGFYYATEYFTIYAGYGLAFWQGCRRYASGEIRQAGDVVTVIFAVILWATALTQVIPQFVHISKATSAAAELFQIIDRKPLIDSLDPSGLKPKECRGLVELRDVHFQYPTRPDVPVLKGINLTLDPGKTTAIVGASGSGKSTIVGLLERWYSPSAGSIAIDHQKIEELNIEWLRTNIRIVQQEPVLFNTTIFQNVAYGLIGTEWQSTSPEKQMELVVEACKSANAHEFIEQQPEGYRTIVGERASRLSGGQKQRIAIARSIISQPKILLLDEATSALDPKAERLVQDVLDKVSATRTTLIIAHKLSTVRKADNIIVMQAGCIIEQGTHNDLLAVNGAYARLVRAQDLGDDGDSSRQPEAIRQLTRSKTTQAEDIAQIDQAIQDKAKSGGLINLLVRTIKERPELWTSFWVIFLGCVLGGGGFPVSAVLFAKAISVFVLSGDELVRQGDFWALMFFIVAVGIFFIYFVLGLASNKASQDLAYDYRLDMFNDFARQDISFFDKPENTTGAIASRLSSYPTQYQELMSINISLVLINLVQIMASSILAIAYAWKIGLVVVFGGLTVISFAGYLRIRLENMLDESTTQKFADSAALASEATSSIRTVSSLALEQTILKEYQDRLAHVERASVKSLVWTMLWFSLTQSVNLLAMALGFWYGSTLVAAGEYTLEQFYVAFTAVLFSGEGAAAIFQYSTSVSKATSASNYMFWLKDSEPSIRELGPDHGFSSSEKAGLSYNDVKFTYPARPDIPVLRGIDIDVQPGRSVAFVGPSGCGKTTMLALAERFYDVDSGNILFDGQDISKVCPRELRSHIALVSQEPTLYQGSVKENVSMGFETANDDQIEEACKLANIHEFIISLPEGYNTTCGNRGTSLSGGQRQRIAIARALIRRPKLLLLDEATSALDTESEKIVQEALERGREDCTTVAIAHRLSTIKDYDMIYVFAKGKIIESGTHRELLARKDVYYEMCLGQGLDSQ